MSHVSASPREVITVYWQHLRRYPLRTIFLLFCVVGAEILMTVLTPWLYKFLLDGVAAQGAVGNPEVLAHLLGILGVIILVRTFGQGFWRLSGFTASWLQPQVMNDLEQTAFHQLLGHSYDFFTNAFAGSLVRKVTRLSRAFADICESFLWRLIPLTVASSAIIYVLVRQAPWIAAIVGVWVVFTIGMNIGFSRWKLKYDVQRVQKDSEVTGVLSDAISSSVAISLFTGIRAEESLFAKVTAERQEMHRHSWRLAEWGVVIQSITMILLEVIIMFLALKMWSQGAISVGTVALVQLYAYSLFTRFFDFGRVMRTVYEAVADAGEMVEILNLPHEIRDASRAKKLQVSKAQIEFRKVIFAYKKQRERRVLDELQLKIVSGEKVALIGSSGAGKSTLVKLLFRFYDIDKGAILIDGQDIAKVTQESLRQAISLVPQDPILFHRSLLDNIRYGRRDASDVEVIQAAKQAHCHEFISALPNGYDTLVGERGVKLSGGERQRVAIARAILKDAPILVLDEATSSLDSESEALIQEALKALMKKKTVIVIAHRLSTIMQMDRIIVMEDGHVADTGTHDELLKKPGTYQKLWNIQAGGFLTE